MVDDAQAIAALRNDWDELPRVVAATFDEPTPAGVASALQRHVREHLHSEVSAYEFFRASVSSVIGLELATGDRVVVKVHRRGTSVAYLRAVQKLQAELAGDGFPSPVPLLGPVELESGIAITESLIDRGVRPDAHDLSDRFVLAAGLAELIERCRPFAGTPGLGEHFMAHEPASLWPRPHDLRFDFEGTSAGAGWIDEIALAAKAARDAGDVVVGHTDWRVEHVRVDDGALSAVYDWDLAVAPEAHFVGGAAHGFTADWSVPNRRQMPTAEEACGFIDDYERARGRPFTDDEHRSVHAALVYAMAYTARCEHSDAATGGGRHAPRPPEKADRLTGARGFLRAHAADLLAP